MGVWGIDMLMMWMKKGFGVGGGRLRLVSEITIAATEVERADR